MPFFCPHRKNNILKTTTTFASLATLTMALSCSTAEAALHTTETKIVASDATEGDDFGVSVAISGNTALVGATGNDDAGGSSGSAYLFDITTGNQLTKLTASDAATGDSFGTSVALSGNTALVGASGNDSAYLFDITTGNQLTKLTASDAATGDRFGWSAAISDNTALVGATRNDDAGSAYLFDITTGNQLTKLTASDAAAGDEFGWSMAVSGNTALVGALGNDDAGSAYLFDIATGNQLAKLTASDAATGDRFGYSVAISDNIALVGATHNDDAGFDSGSAYLFDITTGNQLAKLTASDAAAGDEFGWSVAISGNTALVGAFGDDHAGFASGSAYLFDITTGNQLAKLTASDATAFNYFGEAVAISGTTVLVGAGGDYSGSAYLYEIVPEPSSLLLSASSVAGLLTQRRRRKYSQNRI